MTEETMMRQCVAHKIVEAHRSHKWIHEMDAIKNLFTRNHQNRGLEKEKKNEYNIQNEINFNIYLRVI